MRKSRNFKKSEPKVNDNDFLKSFDLNIIEKADDKNNPYYFEGIASTYKNIDAYDDIFVEGSLDEMIGKTVPIIPNHCGDIFKALGSGTIYREGNKIMIKGEFRQDGNPDVDTILFLKKSGVQIPVSIGGRILEKTFEQVNGRAVRKILKADIKEVSVVLAAANPKAKITKSDEGDENMGFNINEEDYKKMMKKVEEIENLHKSLEEANKKIEELSKADNKAEIEKLEKSYKEELEKIQKSLTEKEEEAKKMAEKLDELEKMGQIDIGGKVGTENALNLKKHMDALDTFIRTGEKDSFLKGIEDTSLNTGIGSGEALIPEERANEIIKTLKETSPVFADAKVYRTSTAELTIPVRVEQENGFGNEAEGGNVNGGKDVGPKKKVLKYTDLKLKAGKISTVVQLTDEMINDSAFPVMTEVMDVTKQDLSEVFGERVFNGVYEQADENNVKNYFEGIYQTKDVTDKAMISSVVDSFTGEDVERLASEMQKSYRANGKFYAGTKAFATLKAMRNADGTKRYDFVNGKLIIDGFVCEEEPYMDEIAAGKFPILFANMKEFYAIILRKQMTVEKDRVAKGDVYDIYSRARIGGRVRNKVYGRLLKIRASADEPTLESIAVTPKTATANAKGAKQFKATGTYTDKSTRDITDLCVWDSSNKTTATIDNKGLANVLATGSTNITAKLDGITGTATLTATIAG